MRNSDNKKSYPVADHCLRNFYYTKEDLDSMKKNLDHQLTFVTEELKGQLAAKFKDVSDQFKKDGCIDESDFRQRF